MVAATLLTLALTVPSQCANDIGAMAQYKATIRPVKDESPLSGKEFELTVLTVEEEAADVAWGITSETGLAALAWPARMGRLTQDGPVIRVHWGDGDSAVKLPSVLFQSLEDPLGRDKREFKVGKETWLSGEPKDSTNGRVWKVIRKGGLGGGASATIDESGWPTELTSQFTVGRGFPYELILKRTKLSRLTKEETALANKQLDQWLELVDTMGFAIEEESTPQLEREQLKVAVTELSKLGAVKSPWTRVIAHSQKSLREQGASAVAVEVMIERVMGKKVWPALSRDLRDKPIGNEKWKNGIVVLHFWGYQNTPLKQPYGQVGFLDFLSRKRDDIQIVGIVSHEAVRQVDGKAGALRSARKFGEFMNISYPIVVANQLLTDIGDPRNHNADLPMFVVLNAAGKVCYVKVGLFDVDPQRGLTELEAAIDEVAGKSK